MLRIAVLGAAHPHVQYALDEIAADTSGAIHLIGVQDRDRDVARRHAETFAAAATTEAEALLSGTPDLVVVAGRYDDRGTDVVAALEAGADVLADKPLCTTLADLERIEAAVARTGGRVGLMLEKRSYPETRAALDLVAAGILGEVVAISSSAPHKLSPARRPTWFLDPTHYGGILGDLTVHDLDLALLFAPMSGAEVRGVVTAPLPGGFHRYGVASLRSPEVAITAEVSWLTPEASAVHGDYRMQVVGTEGTLDLLWARGELRLTTHHQPTRLVDCPPPVRPAQAAVAAALAGEPPPVGTAESITATRLALLAQAAAEDGSPRHWTRADTSGGSR